MRRFVAKAVGSGTSFRVRFEGEPRPLINKHPPLSRNCNRDPNIKALKRRGFIN